MDIAIKDIHCKDIDGNIEDVYTKHVMKNGKM